MSGWAALAQAGADAFSLWHNRAERKAQQDFQQGEAASARAWQERLFDRGVELSNTAYQRQVKDMQAAGINPMLAVTGGSGAGGSSTPGTGIPAGGMAGGSLGSSALDKLRLREEIGLLQEQQKTQQESQWQIRQDANLKSVQYNTELQRYDDMYWQAKKTEQEAGMAASAAKGIKLEGEIDETKYGAFMRYLDRAMRSLTGGSSAYRNMGK